MPRRAEREDDGRLHPARPRLRIDLPTCRTIFGLKQRARRTICMLSARVNGSLKFAVTLRPDGAYTNMTQRSDTPPASNHRNDAQSSNARTFLRQHRFGLLVGGLLAVGAVASIANARPGAAHPMCGMMHPQDTTTTATPDPSGKVLITADARGFHPASIETTKGQRTTLEFRRTTDETCATSVVFPELKIEKALPLNQAVTVELPVGSSSTLTFQCGMGMYRGKIVVH